MSIAISKFSCLLTKVLQMRQKQLTHPPIQCIMHYKHNVLLRTCQLSIGNVSIVSYFAHKLLIILITNKTNPNAHLRVWDLVVKYIIGALIQHNLFS